MTGIAGTIYAAGGTGGSTTTTSLSGLQYIASGASLPDTLWGGGPGSGGAANNTIQTRSGYFMGKYPTNVIVIGMVGYTFEPSIGDSPYGNAVTLEAAIELTTPAYAQQCTFNNSPTVNVPNGSPGVFSDPLGIYIAGDSEFYVRHGEYSASGGLNVVPGCDQGAPAGSGGLVAINAASQIQATGTISGANITGTKIPILLGIPSSPQVAVCIFGDSIPTGTGDTPTAAGDSGFIARGLVSVNGHRMVCAKQTVGSQTFSVTTVQQCSRSRALWRYFTHFICEMGTNDIASATSLASMQTYATNVWTAAKRTIGPYGKPLQVAQTLIMPRTSSTDSWATAANQTPLAGFTVGGVRDQFNAWVKTQVGGGLLDAYIDVNQYVEDQANLGKWLTNGTASYPTADGVHPSMAYHILAAQAVNSWALNQTP